MNRYGTMSANMGKRQEKTEKAIFLAFESLLSEKRYSQITVQEIIRRAGIGRTTFYEHFSTKDELLESMCRILFDHVIASASSKAQGRYSSDEAPSSLFCHLLQHISENDENILTVLSCESRDIFLRCFRESLSFLAEDMLDSGRLKAVDGVPREFFISHISGSFIEMVLWWIDSGLRYSPEELDQAFRRMNQIGD